MNEDERLRAMLKEDTGSDEQADALLGTVKRLRKWQAPEAANTAQLINLLAAQFPRQKSRRERLWEWQPLVLMRSQARIVSGGIMLASLLVMALGAFVAAIMTIPNGSTPLALIAPLVAAMGIAFIYGEDVDPPLELLLTTPVSPRLVLLARMALVFGFDLLLGVAASLALVALRSEWTFGALVALWLAPMTFLSALALFTSTLLKDTLAGVAMSLFIWGALCAGHLMHVYGTPTFLPDFTIASAQPFLWVMGAALAIAALWLAGNEEHWVAGEQ
jgi:hypothetical protein